MPPRDGELEKLAAALEATGNYRVLRRLKCPESFRDLDQGPTKLGIVIDVETTGLNSNLDEIIELGMIKFEYSADGKLLRIVGRFSGLRDPGISIPKEITDLTGISQKDVAGHSIDRGEIARFIDNAAIIVAHNAGFDRLFCERLWPEFASKPWACSTSEIDWRAHGYRGARLSYLLAGHGYFMDEHRALNDCEALLVILASESGCFSELLENARRTSHRVYAEGAPFEQKDVLKSRGYRWFEATSKRQKSWRKDLFEQELTAELEFLQAKVFGGKKVNIPVEKLTAAERYSVRG